MTTMYAPRQVVNYTAFPEDWYSPVSSRSHTRNYYDTTDFYSQDMYICPQELAVSSPLSPPLDDYAFSPPPPPYSASHGTTIEDRSPMDYCTSNQRKRPSPVSMCQSPSQRSYTAPRISMHKAPRPSITYNHHPANLPSPPHSPINTIPTATPVPITTTTTTSTQRHYCQQTACLDPATGKPTRSFSRRADLQRHHATAHDPPQIFSCPRPKCARKGENGFTRHDHLIEHRRGFHGEGIPKRRSRGKSAESKQR